MKSLEVQDTYSAPQGTLVQHFTFFNLVL